MQDTQKQRGYHLLPTENKTEWKKAVAPLFIFELYYCSALTVSSLVS